MLHTKGGVIENRENAFLVFMKFPLFILSRLSPKALSYMQYNKKKKEFADKTNFKPYTALVSSVYLAILG